MLRIRIQGLPGSGSGLRFFAGSGFDEYESETLLPLKILLITTIQTIKILGAHLEAFRRECSLSQNIKRQTGLFGLTSSLEYR